MVVWQIGRPVLRFVWAGRCPLLQIEPMTIHTIPNDGKMNIVSLEKELYNLLYMNKYQVSPPKKTGHCLISCNVKAIKAIAMK
jgi:hypothetical protein